MISNQLNDEFKKQLVNHFTGEFKFNYTLAPLTWLKVGGHAEVLYKPNGIEDLSKFLAYLPEGIDVNFIGAGSNLLIRDIGIPGITIKLGRAFSYIDLHSQTLHIGAATLNYNLSKFCLENEIGGLEFISGIPGSIGGGVAMNAGCYGKEFKDIVKKITAINRKGEILSLTPEEMQFHYRGYGLNEKLLFVSVEFKWEHKNKKDIQNILENIKQQRKATQPINQKTAGSTFANPTGNYKAWQLIDGVGMRGFKVGDAQISTLHSNFLINNGNASSYDLEKLAELARKKVYDQTGIMLEWEVIRLGNNKQM